MASILHGRHCTPRDYDLLAALYLSPLTVDQILRLSQTWSSPFPQIDVLYHRLQKLTAAGWVCRWRYAIASRDASPDYLKLTHQGYRLLTGSDRARAPTKRFFSAVARSRHLHTFHLAEFIVHTVNSCHCHGVPISDCRPEATVRCDVDGTTLSPDFVFRLTARTGEHFNYCTELDNSTESIESLDTDSIATKIRGYETLHYKAPEYFRVLFVCTGSRERAAHILDAARGLVMEPRRTIFQTVYLPDYLAEPSAVSKRIFRDQRGRRVSLLPHYLPGVRRQGSKAPICLAPRLAIA